MTEDWMYRSLHKEIRRGVFVPRDKGLRGIEYACIRRTMVSFRGHRGLRNVDMVPLIVRRARELLLPLTWWRKDRQQGSKLEHGVTSDVKLKSVGRFISSEVRSSPMPKVWERVTWQAFYSVVGVLEPPLMLRIDQPVRLPVQTESIIQCEALSDV